MQTETNTTTTETQAPEVGTMPFRFEVTTLPVADVDRAKAFYLKLGWRLDIDFHPLPGVRGVQFTPPGSPASIQFGSGGAKLAGPLQNLYLIVDDIEAARDELIGRGVEVGEIQDVGGGVLYASLEDPDGNSLTLQEMPWRKGDAFS
jgi:catechol 2,3-dioxygenase-like lactoylglutathione lyase family enzyme